jgi:hypothetical protein
MGMYMIQKIRYMKISSGLYILPDWGVRWTVSTC